MGVALMIALLAIAGIPAISYLSSGLGETFCLELNDFDPDFNEDASG